MDGKRIVMMGLSYGAMAALRASSKSFREKFLGGETFAVIVSVYRGATSRAVPTIRTTSGTFTTTPRDFDPAHSIWREYVADLQDASDRREWTSRFYSMRPETMTAPAVVATFGCFSYARSSGDRIRLHFQNAETDGHFPLAIERRGERLEELTALVEHVKRTLRQPVQMVGASWLDSLEQCFPFQVLAVEASIQEFYDFYGI